jgi:microcystin-dependent protein
MANKIEIFENSLLRLLVRRGTDADRQGALLSQGELGYTIDTKKLYVGDGSTVGGILIGNVFAGTNNNVTTFIGASVGDLAYDSDSKVLYRLVATPASIISNWEVIGGVYGADNTTILQSPANTFSVGVISAANIDTNIVGNSLTFTGGKISLNSQTISANAVVSSTADYLSLPGKLSINNIQYEWPAATSQNLFLTTDVAGKLSWAQPLQPSTLFVTGTASQLPVGTIMPVASNSSAPLGWILCDGQTVATTTYPLLYAAIGTTYGGTASNFKVPDLINKSLYGAATNPHATTVYSLCARTTNISVLSATGMLYFIKATIDPVVSSTITFTNGLSSSLNGTNSTGITVTPLSGNHVVGLPYVTTAQTVSGSFKIDGFGRVIAVINAESAEFEKAGTTTPAGSNFLYNVTSPITFLRTPVTVYSHDSPYVSTEPGASSAPLISFRSTLTAYPVITMLTTGVAATPNTVIPGNAKNLIVQSRVTKILDWPAGATYRQPRLIVSSPDIALLESINANFAGVHENTVSFVRGNWRDNIAMSNDLSECSVTQTFLPLSATNTGALITAFRSPPSRFDTVEIKILGYTI